MNAVMAKENILHINAKLKNKKIIIQTSLQCKCFQQYSHKYQKKLRLRSLSKKKKIYYSEEFILKEEQ